MFFKHKTVSLSSRAAPSAYTQSVRGTYGETYEEIGPCFDTTKFSDEYSNFGEFTGTFVGITCGDRMMHSHTADFDFFDYEADDYADVE